jgi:hypothetical protein
MDCGRRCRRVACCPGWNCCASILTASRSRRLRRVGGVERVPMRKTIRWWESSEVHYRCPGNRHWKNQKNRCKSQIPVKWMWDSVVLRQIAILFLLFFFTLSFLFFILFFSSFFLKFQKLNI